MLHEPPAAVELHEVGVRYGRHAAVAQLSTRFAAGRLHAVMGPNGAGKSSLIAAMAGLQPHTGHIRLAPELAGRVGCLPQRALVDRSFPITVADFAAMGLWPRLGAFRGIGRGELLDIGRTLDRLGLQTLSHRLIGELSTGQFQRLLFARLCLQEARLLLLDEPFAALDEDTTADLLALLQDWRAQGRTVIAVLHEHQIARAHFDEVLLMARSAVVHGGADDALAPAAWRSAEQRLAAHHAEACTA